MAHTYPQAIGDRHPDPGGGTAVRATATPAAGIACRPAGAAEAGGIRLALVAVCADADHPACRLGNAVCRRLPGHAERFVASAAYLPRRSDRIRDSAPPAYLACPAAIRHLPRTHGRGALSRTDQT